MEPCLFCGGDPNDPDHAELCRIAQEEQPSWIPPIAASSEALDGLSPEALEAILGAVTPEQVHTLIGLLGPEPQHVDVIRHALGAYPWFPSHAKRDTQLRRIRTIRDAAVVYGHPVCSTNAGYSLGDWERVHAAARRARRFARGAYIRAAVLEQLAGKMAPR